MLPLEAFAPLFAVTTALEQIGVRYLVGGSAGSMLSGVPRLTRDFDLLAALEPHHVAPLAELLTPDFYLPSEAILDAVRSRTSFNVIHFETVFKIDVFCTRGRAFDEKQLDRRQWIAVRDVHPQGFWVASPEDTILCKLEWFQESKSDLQWQDIMGVLASCAASLDYSYLELEAAELGVTGLLVKALRESTEH